MDPYKGMEVPVPEISKISTHGVISVLWSTRMKEPNLALLSFDNKAGRLLEGSSPPMEIRIESENDEVIKEDLLIERLDVTDFSGR